MAENVGAIYYTVESDTSAVVNSATTVDTSLDKMNRQFAKTDKAANDVQFQMTKTATAVRGLGQESAGATSSLGGLGKVLGGLLTIQGIGSLITMAEAYNEMAERIRMATSSAAEYEMVQQRLLATANGTYRSMAEAQEVYILTADSLRSMGYSTEQALDIVDSLSYSFVKNAASTQRADSAISAYTKSIQTGKVAADSWQSVIAAVPSIINDIATASGKTSAEIREMGASGKLTAQMLNEGLRQSLESNKAASDGMATTVKDAFTAMRNNLAAYIGEANQASGSTGVLSKSILLLGENIDTIVKLLMVAGAGALAKYIAQMGASVIASGRAMLAARAQAAEEMRLAQAHAATTAAALAHAQANGFVAGSHATASAAAKAHQAALAGVAAASRTAATAGATLMGVLGGPAGIIALIATAATGMYLFSSSTADSTRELLDMDQSLDSVKEKFKDLTESQRSLAMESAKLNIAKSITDLDSAFDDLNKGSLADGTRAVAKWRAETSGQVEELVNAAKAGGISYQELDTRLVALIRSYAEANGRSEEWISQQIEFASKVSDGAKKLNNAEVASYRLGDANRELAGATGAAADEQARLNGALAGMDGAAGKYLKTLQDRVGALQDGNSEVKKAERLLSDLKSSGEAVGTEVATAIMSAAMAADNLRESQEKAKKSSKSAASEASKAAKEAAAAEKENIKVLDELAVAMMNASLKGEELAIVKAQASLNKFATPEDIQNVTNMAKAIWQVAEAEKNRSLLNQLDPIAGEQSKFETEMENLRKLNEAKLLEDVRYLELKTQAETAHDEQMRVLQEENFRRQSNWNDLLIGSLDRLGEAATSSISGLITGATNGTEVIQSLAQAIMHDAIGSLVKMGIQYVKNLVMGQAAQAAATAAGVAQASTLAVAWAVPAALASLASFGANSVPAMAGIASTVALSEGLAVVGGGRQYGGPVAAGAMHRINENGAPEVLNTANGRQYLLPNSRGEVVSNKDAQGGNGGAAPTIIIQQIESQERAGQVEQSRGADQEQVITLFVADIRGGGKASDAMERTYGLKRRGS